MKVILISGASCSGKSTLAQKLAEALGNKALLISQDDYYHDLSCLPEKEVSQYNFDKPNAVDLDLLYRDLLLLKNHKPVYKKSYSFVKHKRVTTKEILKTKEFVIVEGLFTLYSKKVYQLANLSVFMKVSLDEAWKRRLKRDVEDRGMNEDTLKIQFNEQVVPMYNQYIKPTINKADLVIDGEEPLEQFVSEIISTVSD